MVTRSLILAGVALCVLSAQQIFPPIAPLPVAPPYGPITFTASAVAQNIPQATHHFTTQLVKTVCYDGATNQETMIPVAVNPGTLMVTISPAEAFTGTCFIYGTGPPQAPQGASPPYGPISFSSAAARTIASSSHGFSARSIKSICYDTASSLETYIPTAVNAGTFAVTLSPAESFTGTCYLYGTGPGVGGGSGPPPYGPVSFSSATPQTISAATHGLTIQAINVLCIETGTNGIASVPASVDPSTLAVTISPAVSFTGKCWLGQLK